jgi:hypothetical protein
MAGPLRAPSAPPRDAGAQIEDTRLSQRRATPPGILKAGVATIDDHITRCQMRAQASDLCIHLRACLDHEQDPPRRRHPCGQLRLVGGDRHVVGAPCPRALPGIRRDNVEPVAGRVERQIAPHDAEADQPELLFHLLLRLAFPEV